MCSLYKNILSLCDERGIKGGKMCVDIGASKSLLTDLKSGRKKSINSETAKKIADYFGVDTDRVLFGKETAPAEAETDDEIAELLETIRRRPDLQVLFSLSKKATPDDVRKTIQIIKTVCGDNDGDNYNQIP